MLHVTGGLQGDGMMMTAVMTSSRLKVGGGEKLRHSPMEDFFREFPLSILMTLQNTVIIELNY